MRMANTHWLRSLASGIPIGISFVTSVCYVAKVNGVSMQPILNPDSGTCDYVLLNRWAVRDFKIKRGEIVSLISPRNPEACLIKRVIGLEGDVVLTKGYNHSAVQIPEGYCWIEGENHSQSMDSNFFGPIPLGLITAKATHIVWPFNRNWQYNMRAVSYVERLEFDFPGSVFKNAFLFGDVDNDKCEELVVGNEAGDVFVFKGTSSKCWRRASDLGMVTAIGIGDIFNLGRNSLVIVNGEGWCYIFDFLTDTCCDGELIMKPSHVQRIPANTKVLLLHDVNSDGMIELVIGLTDRVVRTYQWINTKLVGLNKWEFANQIGTVAINDMANRTPSLLVAHPGGTFIRLKCKPFENCEEHGKEQRELLSKMSIDYHPLAYSHMRNPNVSTEILGNISQGISQQNENQGALYAVATLDGTLMMVQDEQILWNLVVILQIFSMEVIFLRNRTFEMANEWHIRFFKIFWQYPSPEDEENLVQCTKSLQVDHQLFALSKLDITGDGREEVVACSWDGQTYIVNQEKQTVRFQFDQPVSAFTAGYYSLNSQAPPSPALAYATFHNKIYVYHNVSLPRITLHTSSELLEKHPEKRNESLLKYVANPSKMRELFAKTLYNVKLV